MDAFDSSENPDALFWTALPGEKVQCLLCQRRCVIAEGAPPQGHTGHCRARKNVGGKLKPLTYGRVSTLHWANVERKPLFHFFPGEVMLSVGSLGCNLRCPGCQNWGIAHADVSSGLRETRFIPPEELVEMAAKEHCLGISWTYNEPTIWFEYTLDAAILAKRRGLSTNYVTNGAITVEALDRIGPYLDAYRVDIKGFSEETYRRVTTFAGFRGILDVAERARKKWGMHVECITNIIPGYNDDPAELKAIAEWIEGRLGPETPWHATGFAPHLDLSDVPRTPIETLERARQIGFDAGLQFVYIGNVAMHPGENTFCPGCKTLLIERADGPVRSKGMVVEKDGGSGRCGRCGAKIAGRFRAT